MSDVTSGLKNIRYNTFRNWLCVKPRERHNTDAWKKQFSLIVSLNVWDAWKRPSVWNPSTGVGHKKIIFRNINNILF